MRTRTGNQSDMAKLRRLVNKPTIMDKSLGTLLHFLAFSNSHRTNPFPHPTSNVGRVYLEFFSEFRHCMYPYRVKGGGGGGGGEIELQGNFEKDGLFYEGTRNEFCITVPRTFVHDCSTCANSVEVTSCEYSPLRMPCCYGYSLYDWRVRKHSMARHCGCKRDDEEGHITFLNLFNW